MFETKNDLDPAIRKEAIELLNEHLAERKGIREANSLAELDTADVFTEVSRGIDKWPRPPTALPRSTRTPRASGR